MHQPFCTIIVLNYEGETYLSKTIESLLDLDYPKNRYEIIVVDNASKDKSREIIEKYGVKIKPLFLGTNKGFSAGNNEGIKDAKGEYVALLNNDCVVDKGWLSELVLTADNDPRIFAVNSKIMLGKTNKIQNAGITVFPDGYARDRGAVPINGKQDYEEDRGQYSKETEIDAACAAAVLYRKSILDQIGLLDENFFMYYEDVELSERARKHGYRIVYCPKAIAYHEHAKSSKEWSPFFIYHSERGRLMHTLFHFPLQVFFREYVIFSVKAKLRFLARLFTEPSSIAKNWQYLRVKWYFLIRLPILVSKRSNL